MLQKARAKVPCISNLLSLLEASVSLRHDLRALNKLRMFQLCWSEFTEYAPLVYYFMVSMKARHSETNDVTTHITFECMLPCWGAFRSILGQGQLKRKPSTRRWLSLVYFPGKCNSIPSVKARVGRATWRRDGKKTCNPLEATQFSSRLSVVLHDSTFPSPHHTTDYFMILCLKKFLCPCRGVRAQHLPGRPTWIFHAEN